MTQSSTPFFVPVSKPPVKRRDIPSAVAGAIGAGLMAGYLASVIFWHIEPAITAKIDSMGWHFLALLKSFADWLNLGFHGWAKIYFNTVWHTGFATQWRVAATYYTGLATAFVVYRVLSKEIDPIIHNKGRQLLPTKTLAKITNTQKTPEDHTFIDGIKLSNSVIAKGITAIGSSGGGKTQLIHCLWPQLKKSGWRGIIIDGAKGDYSSAEQYADCHIIAPWHKGLSWDIGRDCTSRAAAGGADSDGRSAGPHSASHGNGPAGLGCLPHR